MKKQVIVVGGGLAGLMTTIKVAEAGGQVDLFSVVPVKRSHSVCAQGGINGAVNTKGEGDSTAEHLDDTVYGGDFLGNQPPIKGMCDAAPGIIYMLDRMGVPFNRTAEGLLDFRRFGGTKHHRTAFAGATTGQQLLYALDEQVRRYESEGLVNKFEGWEFMRLIRDDEGKTCGIVAVNNVTMEVKAFRSDAVVFATGGPGLIFGKSTNSSINTGSAMAILYQQGAHYANGEFIQVHPTAIPGADKLRLMSESARGEGGRVWTYKDGKPWYFLEEMYPAYGNLVPRDIATRAIFKVCTEMKLGINGENMVYLDLSHIDSKVLDRKLGGILDIYEKYVGEDPHKVPMKIFPAVHYSMGGMWVDFKHQSNIPGTFGAGECEYQYHGANRLGANSLLSCIYSGMIAGPESLKYISGVKKSAHDLPSTLFDREEKLVKDQIDSVKKMSGSENAYKMWESLGTEMTNNVTIVRYNKNIEKTVGWLGELRARWDKIGVYDQSGWVNRDLLFTINLKNMIDLARAIAQGAFQRNESRGAHYKPDFPDRDDEKFMKTTIADYTPDGPKISYEAVDTSIIKPRPRKYDVDKKAG